MSDQEVEKTYIERQTLINYNILSDQKTVCTTHINLNKLCFEEKIEYPDLSTIKNKEIVTLIKSDILKMLETFKETDIRKEFNEVYSSEYNSDFYNHTSYHIFSSTPKILTISYSLSSYGGGAHGSYAESYQNIDKRTRKELELEDILKPNQKDAFYEFAEKFYRKLRYLSPTDSMKDAGWFNDKFYLSDNFAVTPQGLYFLYNSYEIQPYAMGQEIILLPYEKISKFLSEKYFDEPTLNKINKLAHSYKKTFNNNLTLEVMSTKKNRVKISIAATNTLYGTTEGWLTVSFKELKGKEVKVKLLNNGFEKFNSYESGSKIYNKKEKKAMKSHYFMVESSSKKWESDEKRKLAFELEVPKELKQLTILLRLVQKYDGRMIEHYESDEEILEEGQQGYKNFVLKIDL